MAINGHGIICYQFVNRIPSRRRTPKNLRIFCMHAARCAIILKYERAAAMRKKSRIVGYILLNIFISAATVLLVLWIWEQAHPTPRLEQDGGFIPGAEGDPSSSDGLDPGRQVETSSPALSFVTGEVQVNIHSIVGSGNLEVEYVEIRNQSQGPIDMTNWQLTDQDGNVFVFPTLILNEDGAIKVLSKAGNNTVIELYWQSEVPIWQSGETASLLNADGDIISTYSIP